MKQNKASKKKLNKKDTDMAGGRFVFGSVSAYEWSVVLPTMGFVSFCSGLKFQGWRNRTFLQPPFRAKHHSALTANT